VKKWIDYAADLWAPHVRIFAGSAPQGSQKEEVMDGSQNRSNRCSIMLKNKVWLSAWKITMASLRFRRLLAICNLVGKHPYFGVNLDTGNFRRSPYEDLKVVAPLAVNVQIKIEVFQGDNKVLADLSRFRDIILDAGYKGWVPSSMKARGILSKSARSI
jgi:hypothetical protein